MSSSPDLENKQKQIQPQINQNQRNNNREKLKVVFAPQFLKINPYQKQLAEHLERLGVQMQGICYRTIFLPTELNQLNPNILHLHWLHTFFDAASTIGSLRRTVKFISGLIILKLKDIKIVWTVHNIKNHENLYLLSDRICTFIVTRLADAIIVHSETAKNEIATKLHLKKLDKLFVVPHGNYIENYENNINQTEARKLLGIPDTGVVLLFFGLIRPYKGIPEMLNAFKQLHNNKVYLVIAGKARDDKDNQLVDFIEQAVESNQNIKFVPKFIPEDQVQVYMNACDVVIFPYRDFLTSGAVVLAMSFGRACIAPRKGSVSELLDDGGAILYDPDTEDGLMQAMKCASERKANLLEMGEHNYKLAKKWSWELVAEMTLSIYRKCMRN
ncbi:glycosyltransferase [Fischerella sp. PCC 9605]|uniref:glycosyltransferase n=1 Tax=Fischerella sp. PCC 9605 TaxID=1173024 RepID=UPI00047DD873|nr:glycosyltransferase [Fischerella sp. PCC 9605]